MTSPARTMLSPNDIASQWGVARETVVSWILSGELVGCNLAAPGKQPRYRVDVADLEAFKLRRRVVQAPPVSRRRKRAGCGFTEYF